MNTTNKKLKRLEKYFTRRLDKEYGDLKHWVFFGDMYKGRLIILVSAREKK